MNQSNRYKSQSSRALLAASALCVGLSVFSASAAFAKAAPVDAAKVLASMDGSAGEVEFKSTGHPSSIKIVGKGSGPKGEFKIEKNQITGNASFDLNTLKTGIAMRDEHMKDKYLEVKKYPQAVLTLTKLQLPEGANGSKGSFSFSSVPFEGKMKLHGVEKNVSGVASVSAQNGTAQIKAEFGIKVAEYGISKASFAGITMADDVDVLVNGSAKISKN